MSEQFSIQPEKVSTHAHLAQVGGAARVVSASGGEFQPSPHENIAQQKKIANAAPLGLAEFALTTFVLSLINLGARKVHEPNLVVALAFGYGGLVQLSAGMWEMAIGNTFGATALSSYGGFWLSFAVVLTPAFNIVDSYTDKTTGVSDFGQVFALYLWAWFIFTTLCMLLTLRSTVAFASLFIVLDLAFLCLALAEQNGSAALQKAGGAFGLVAAILAWYNMFAGMADSTNFWFNIPVSHLPWSEKKKAERSRV
ncbi:Accumulation of DYads protein [Knufia obscura]|uniref:Accumulation of DYads protein n=2 Tax=Knufia TaxID=430999 RepID=A0AAN8EBZ3_9EURO|nr:Accumulation of DYads protein [Knufia obscura]KAK5950515.1 Accumulation of DYads protein [Knufia fluminis]